MLKKLFLYSENERYTIYHVDENNILKGSHIEYYKNKPIRQIIYKNGAFNNVYIEYYSYNIYNMCTWKNDELHGIDIKLY